MQLKDVNLLSFGHTVQMSGVLFSGDGRTYLCFFPESEDKYQHVSLDMNLEEWKTLMHQVDVMETEVLTKGPGGELTKIILRKSQRAVDAACTWKVFKRDEYACRYCGNDNTPLTVDHLVCWEAGGPSIEANLVTSCRKCNKTRGNLSYEEWLQHPRYLQGASNLSFDQRAANEALAKTLDKIPLLIHKRSR